MYKFGEHELLQCYVVQRHFHQYLSYIVGVNFIGGGNRSTQRKPQICCKSPTKFIT